MSEAMAPNLEGAVPSHLPVLPLKSTVVFPRIFIPLSVGRKKSLGLRRIKLTRAQSEEPYLTCAVEMHPEFSEDILTIEREALMRRAIASFQQLVSLAPHLPAELAGAAGAIDDPLHLAYYVANHIRLTTEQRQEILELDSAKAKLEKLL